MRKQNSFLAGLVVIATLLTSCAHKAPETAAPAPAVAPAPVAEVLSPVDATMLEHKATFTGCYEKHLKKDKSNDGSVVTVFHVNAKGKVTHASIQNTTLKNPATEKCILMAIKKIKFPKGTDKKGTDARYPFEFAGIHH